MLQDVSGDHAAVRAAQGKPCFSLGHHEKADESGDDLTGHGGDGGAGHSEGRKAQKAEDHDRIQNDIDDAADSHQDERRCHVPGGLQNFFCSDMEQLAKRKDHDGISIGIAHGPDGSILRIHAHKGADEKAGQKSQDHIVDAGQDYADGRGVLRGGSAAAPHIPGDVGVDADSCPNGQSQGKILYGVDDGDGGEGIVAQPGHKDAVYDIV